ncbi:hypothetical protein [Parasphingopyxis sp.]|uniref:hypothetical protein n=1 Tax=Parasphingopyxis sp. TaxID=1920299 RepID=UPI00261DFC32|nr:hypothetical protein [Parasphingopyxis sp.]
MTEEELDELGQMSDSLDSALAMQAVSLPPQMHIEGMTAVMEEVRDKLRRFVVDRADHDPWEHQA